MKKTIKQMKESDRPREKLIESGFEALTNTELLAIILQTGTSEKNALELAGEILDAFSTEDLLQIDVRDLTKIKGIKEAKATKVIASLQLGKRLKEEYLNKKYDKITSNEDVYQMFRNMLAMEDREHFYIVLLNNKNMVIGKELISIGDLNSSIVNPREVFKKAIKKSAKSIILVHNHPSGNPDPSKADIMVTRRLIDAGEILDINVLDLSLIHI